MPPLPRSTHFWRSTPPAIFPPVFGLLGLGLAWRQAGSVLNMGSAPSDLILGSVTLLYLFCLGSYAAKLFFRPSALVQDLRILPGRLGLAAMTMSAMLVSAALVPIAPDLARVVIYIATGAHATLAGLVAMVLLTGPAEQRQVTPAWHLTFVGFVAVPLAALPLGLTWLTGGALIVAAIFAVPILVASAVQLRHRDPPAPLRPLLAIHLAPVSLFGTAFAQVPLPHMALVLSLLSCAVLAALLWHARYLTAAPFTAFYSAFTFPLAAYSGLMLAMSERSESVFGVMGVLSLVLASAIIPLIALKVLQSWIKGTLATRTNSAVA